MWASIDTCCFSHIDCHLTKMPLHRYAIILLLLSSFSIDSYIYLYHTEDGMAIEHYDCVLLQSLYYCRRPATPINLSRDNDSASCELNGGRLHRFSELRAKHINTTVILHHWKSSVERAEQYSRYLTHPIVIHDGYLCQCNELSSFGKNCEYHLPFGDTFQQTLDWQLSIRNNNTNQVQIHGDIVCYHTLICNSSLPCLDWREICDGVQHCNEGKDEENCDVLETNVCEDDEYRCMNGMCIPDASFLDGELDCMDWSDEKQYKKSESCAGESVSTQCDDHVCLPNEWSCGDGQCIRDRLAFRLSTDYTTCGNRRDQYFMCETNAYALSWTMPNGRCHAGLQYEALPLTNRTKGDQCVYLLRCALSRGGEKNCPCTLRTPASCYEALYQSCSGLNIAYPNRPLITSFISANYGVATFFQNIVANLWYIAGGTVKCRERLVSFTKPSLMSVTENPARRIHDNVCRQVLTNSPTVPSTGVQKCHRPNESIDVCNEWNACMSITRLNDGFVNCLNKGDEKNSDEMEIRRSCSRAHRHRFRCSIAETTCLSVLALGDSKMDCWNFADELLFGTNPVLSQMHCNDQRKDQCSLLRRYIEQSWMIADHEQMSRHSTIHFRSHCDTFWDLDPPTDENAIKCEQWWVCAEDQARCSTKQCIDQLWVDELQWDCPDAGDEQELLDYMVDIMRLRTSSMNISHPMAIFRADTCLEKNLLACLSPHTLFPQFFCIRRSQIGDGKINCAGAVDERNTLKHCSQSSMLGHHFLCPSTNTCIPYYYHCQPDHRCPNRADDHSWCFRLDQSSPCQDVNDFLCFNGSCAKGGRCNLVFNCQLGEDEYMCDYRSTASSRIIHYRVEKQHQMKMKKKSLRLSQFPSDTETVEVSLRDNSSASSTSITTPSNLSMPAYISAYQCNRGIGVLLINNLTICFCPPQYYGDRCQYHNDRLSVVIQLNLSQSNYASSSDPSLVLKLVLLFFHHNQTLMAHEVHVRPGIQTKTFEKQMTYLVYSHSSIVQKQRRDRYLDRFNILNRHSYSLQIDLYQLRGSARPALIAVWRYYIHFDYLPVFRFFKVLHLKQVSVSHNPCSSNPCHSNAECRPLMNDPSKYICLCSSNYTAQDCSEEYQQCLEGYCAAGALCKASYRRQFHGNHHPYCICPSGRLGDRCEIEHDLCRSNPCHNGGSCFPSAKPDQFVCFCSIEYYGTTCQWEKSSLRLSLDINVHYVGLVLQFFDIDFTSLDLHLVHQRASKSHLPSIEYFRDTNTVPAIVLAKLYSSHQDSSPELYLLAVHDAVMSVKGKTQLSESTRCPHSQTLLEGQYISPSFCFSLLKIVNYRSFSDSISLDLPGQFGTALFS